MARIKKVGKKVAVKKVEEVEKIEEKLEPVVVPPAFNITITIGDATYVGTGETALEALKAIQAPSLDLISTGSVTITNGEKSKTMLFPGMQLKRLLNPYNQDVLVNDLTSGM